MSAPYITIDLEALLQNVIKLKSLLKGNQFLAMIKADAYGHGLVQVAQTISEQVDLLAVARVEEAQSLRDHRITKPIVIMGGVSSVEDLQKAIELNCYIVIHHDKHIQFLQSIKDHSSTKIWLKVQSSMHRLGFRIEAVEQVINELAALNIIPHTFLTHLPSIEKDSLVSLTSQIDAFLKLAKPYHVNISISNTAGILKFPELFLQETNIFRIGRAMYGVSPAADLSIKQLGLKPVMTFNAEIIAINDLMPGESVGYHSQYTATAPERIAVINVGYGDGYPRNHNGYVYFKGHRCPIRGWLSMDMTAISIPNHLSADIGDAVQLWGESLAVESLADDINRSALENLMSLAPRVKRIYQPVHKKEEVLL